MTLWARCDKGCPDPYDCPDLPPPEERCPESRHDPDSPWFYYARCKVVGPHDIHNDGHGTRWFPVDEDKEHE